MTIKVIGLVAEVKFKYIKNSPNHYYISVKEKRQQKPKHGKKSACSVEQCLLIYV